MSIKRTKHYSRVPRERDSDESESLFPLKPKAVEKQWDWAAQVGGQPDTAFTAYSAKTAFNESALLLHPVFGKGIVTAVDGKRIEVLFQDGRRKLVHAT
jgi:hypothetical protein